MEQLIESINGLNKFSWTDAINLLSLLAAWITIAFLLQEKANNNRPYLQVNFELIKSSLACVVLKNVSNVPLTIKKLEFEKKFTSQLSKKIKKVWLITI